MSNPFLFDDEPEVAAPPEMAAPAEAVANPFLIEGAADEAEENPFAPASNPFVFDDDNDGKADAPLVESGEKAAAPASDVDKAMSFFGTTITDDDDVPVNPSEQAQVVVDEPPKKAPPPPRPVAPPNQLTQELISSVSDHLDQTSSHLLERIPKTRTPSPVSMRDLHSPSPTPESANLLMSDAFEMNPVSNVATDNPFVDNDDDLIQPDVIAVQQKMPPRPLPPRPVPPSQPAHAPIPDPVPEPQEPDLFGFESNAPPKPPAPKSNQDILNLFSPPKAEPTKPDLMSSDIFGMDDVNQANLSNAPPKVMPVRPPVPPPPQRTPAAPQATTQPSPPAEKLPTPPPVVARKPSIPKAPSVEQPPPLEIHHNDVVEAAAIKINDEPYTTQDNGFADIEKSDTISDNSSAIESSFRSPGIATPATPFYSGTDPQYLDRSQSPVSKEDEGDPYVNDTPYVNPSDALNPFGLPVVGVAKPPPQLAFPADDFDAFSAKFDGSGYKSPAPADGSFHF